MAKFFSEKRHFSLDLYSLYIEPSVYDEIAEKWSETCISLISTTTLKQMANYKISPGSDRVKILISDDEFYVAVFCESQWYQDLYLLKLPSLQKIASFEGAHDVDGSSEGVFYKSWFITIPTFSYEGGCGGLRVVSLTDGTVAQILSSSFFIKFRVWLRPIPEFKSAGGVGFQLSAPFDFIDYKFYKERAILEINYIIGKLKINIENFGDFYFCKPFEVRRPSEIKSTTPVYEFISRNMLDYFRDDDGNCWEIPERKKSELWFSSGRDKKSLQLLRTGSGNHQAAFREGQENAIRHIVEGRSRLLVVQKTGWGKSFVYFCDRRLETACFQPE